MNRKYLDGSLLSLILVFALLISACSYHVAGRGAGAEGGVTGILPGNVKSIAIPFFQNTTRKPKVESVITSAVVNEFMSSVEVVDVEDAEALLLGTVTAYTLKPVSFTSSDVIQEYRLYVTISFFIVRTIDDKILWQDTQITDYEDFVVDVNDISMSKDAEWNALKVIALDSARLLKERIFEGY